MAVVVEMRDLALASPHAKFLSRRLEGSGAWKSQPCAATSKLDPNNDEGVVDHRHTDAVRRELAIETWSS